MRPQNPSFAVVAAIATALLLVALAIVAPLDGWLKAASPRAAAEDEISQAWILPLGIAPSKGFTGFDDTQCPDGIPFRWQYLSRQPDAWAVFEWLLRYSDKPSGRFLALAGLYAASPEHYLELETTLTDTAQLPDTLRVVVGLGEARLTREDGPTRILLTDSLLTLIRRGVYTKDLAEVEPPHLRCYW